MQVRILPHSLKEINYGPIFPRCVCVLFRVDAVHAVEAVSMLIAYAFLTIFCTVLASLFFKGANMTTTRSRYYVIELYSRPKAGGKFPKIRPIDGAYALNADIALERAMQRNPVRPGECLIASACIYKTQVRMAVDLCMARNAENSEFHELMTVDCPPARFENGAQ